MPGARPQQCAGRPYDGIYEKPMKLFLNQLKAVFGFEPPRASRLRYRETLCHARRKAKVFFAMGGNFLSASPDTMYTAEALRRWTQMLFTIYHRSSARSMNASLTIE